MTSLALFQMMFGVALIGFTLFDAFVTILSLRGGGPATSFISQKLWRLALRFHQYKTSHRLLSASGPVLMILVVMFWYLLLYLGWFLVFQSVQGNVINGSTYTAATGLETLYFTGVTLSGLGYGDFTAEHFPWTIYSTLAVATGTLLTSVGLSYIIAVVPVALEKRQLARQINIVAGDSEQLLKRLDDQDNVEFIWQKLFEIQLDGTKFANKYSAYPVVAYFHTSNANSAFSLAYLKASDLLFYLANHPNKELRPSASAVIALKNLMVSYAESLQHIVDDHADGESDQHERYRVYSSIEKVESELFTWQEFSSVRRVLVTTCLYDGW
ncbi:hypothetical protein [Gilvimarinus sp. 1_MG-2023]|uniref:hypothetical protein n=1 Tax=Gilvimarinus sp. 1_MG-2023 TaxID=3062638 RepID=UPI0026E41EC9|nr:hypothetical protein [Gilvimarinus sp. 1_MG-2023]MDO6746452.1 hypothetical protein [Gilvimarinus sp. 1_MG-2023]